MKGGENGKNEILLVDDSLQKKSLFAVDDEDLSVDNEEDEEKAILPMISDDEDNSVSSRDNQLFESEITKIKNLFKLLRAGVDTQEGAIQFSDDDNNNQKTLETLQKLTLGLRYRPKNNTSFDNVRTNIILVLNTLRKIEEKLIQLQNWSSAGILDNNQQATLNAYKEQWAQLIG